MPVNQVIWHEENIRTIWETSRRCCIMRKVIHKEVTVGGRLDFFLDSVSILVSTSVSTLVSIIVSTSL